MALDFLLGDNLTVKSHDEFYPYGLSGSNNDVGSACRVRIYCKNKERTIYAMLSEPLSFNVRSEWKALFNAVPGASQLLDVGESIVQIAAGRSIKQPWFGRKLWQGTQPLSFTMGFQFVSFDDANKDVYDPMIDLLSLVYPRLDKSEKMLGFGMYFTPGPNLFYDSKSGKGDEGDRVEIQMFPFLSFKGCYITSLNYTVANSFSLDGYPHSVKVSMSFESMDVAYVKSLGDGLGFMEDGFEDPSLNNSALLDAINDSRSAIMKGINEGKSFGSIMKDLGGVLMNAFGGG